jgi:hypothetical protein
MQLARASELNSMILRNDTIDGAEPLLSSRPGIIYIVNDGDGAWSPISRANVPEFIDAACLLATTVPSPFHSLVTTDRWYAAEKKNDAAGLWPWRPDINQEI